MLRGNGGQPIFYCDEDREQFERLVAEGVKRFGHRIHAYCWMDNHVHLAVQVGEVALSKAMQNLAFRYTRWVNKRQCRVGHLFQGRFKALLVDADSYLLELVRYIHLNPVRAGLVSDPVDYAWSGHQAYVGMTKIHWLTTDWVLSQLSKHKKTAIKHYQGFIAAGIGAGYREDFHCGTVAGGMLGDDRFVEAVESQQGRKPSPRVAGADILEAVARTCGVRLDALSTPSRERRLSHVRALAAYLVAEHGDGTLTELGKLLNRDVATLSNGARAMRASLRNDVDVQREIQSVKRRLGLEKVITKA